MTSLGYLAYVLMMLVPPNILTIVSGSISPLDSPTGSKHLSVLAILWNMSSVNTKNELPPDVVNLNELLIVWILDENAEGISDITEGCPPNKSMITEPTGRMSLNEFCISSSFVLLLSNGQYEASLSLVWTGAVEPPALTERCNPLNELSNLTTFLKYFTKLAIEK